MKMAKTYIPQAVDDVTALSRYFGRWSQKMLIGASAAQTTALLELIACVAKFLAEWHKPTPNP